MPRETTISTVLLPLLDRYQSIDIPGLGNISVRQLPATLDEQSHMLYPPMQTLLFSTELKEENSIYDLMPSHLSKKEVKNFNSSVDFAINELINLGKTKIEDLGTIVRSEDGAISLEHIESAARGPLRHLPTVQLNPVQGGGAGLFRTDEKSASKDSAYQSPYRKEPNSPWKSYIGPLLFLFVVLALIALVVKQCDLTKSKSQSVHTPSSVNNTSVSPVTDTTDQIFEHKLLAKYEGVLTEQIIAEGCSIVIGSYSTQINADNRALEVREQGYEVTVAKAANRYRAVVTFDCGELDLDTYMSKVRNQVEPKAWYLSPKDYKSE